MPTKDFPVKVPNRHSCNCRPFRAEQYTLDRVWEGLKENSNYESRKAAVEEFNRANVWRKRGISINPCRLVFRLHESSSRLRFSRTVCQIHS